VVTTTDAPRRPPAGPAAAVPDPATLPTCSFAAGELYHIGALDPADKGRLGPSHEGNGLSVSIHPDAWEAIARLGGSRWWRLRRAGNRFLDAHALTAGQRAALAGWAVGEDLARWTPAWRVTWYDEELDEQRAFACADPEEADAEAAEVGGQVTPATELIATGRLHQLVGGWQDPGLTWDHALIAYAELAGLDGVWFADELSVAALSAPRGVIVPARLPGWTITPAPASLDDPPGEEPW
jgi:hypothetical protein